VIEIRAELHGFSSCDFLSSCQSSEFAISCEFPSSFLEEGRQGQRSCHMNKTDGQYEEKKSEKADRLYNKKYSPTQVMSFHVLTGGREK
jgi:hypothetical protein